MILVVFDTNGLESTKFDPTGTPYKELKELSRQGKILIGVSPVVQTELARHKKLNLNSFDQWLLESGAIHLPDRASHETLDVRSANGLKPFKKSRSPEDNVRGYRDARIWLGIVDCIADLHVPLLFVTANYTDFAASNFDVEGIAKPHDDLLRDFKHASQPVLLAQTPYAALAIVMNSAHGSWFETAFTDDKVALELLESHRDKIEADTLPHIHYPPGFAKQSVLAESAEPPLPRAWLIAPVVESGEWIIRLRPTFVKTELSGGLLIVNAALTGIRSYRAHVQSLSGFHHATTPFGIGVEEFLISQTIETIYVKVKSSVRAMRMNDSLQVKVENANWNSSFQLPAL